MPDVVIRCRDNGPLVVTGDVQILDGDRKPFSLPSNKNDVALCRCGHSQSKPFCDGSHRDTDFAAEERADDEAE